MKKQIETAVPRRKFVAGDSEEACKTLYTTQNKMNRLKMVRFVILIIVLTNSCQVDRQPHDSNQITDTTLSNDSLEKTQFNNQKVADSSTNSDNEKLDYLRKAFLNISTSPDYVVFTAIDSKTNLAKEICCESSDLQRAFFNDITSNIDPAALSNTSKKAANDFENLINSMNNKIVFRFNNSNSLKIIGFYNYCLDSITKYSNNQTYKKIELIKNNFRSLCALEKYFKNPNIYLIHVLYKNGVYCGRDCESGYTVIRKIIK